MKKYFTIIVLAFFTLKAIAQDTIPNPSFERWTSGTGYMNPTGWFSPDSITVAEGGTAEVTQTSTAYSGNFAARLETQSVFGIGIPGALLLGNISIAERKIIGGVPFSKRPLALYGYYKYTPASGNTDSCLAFVILSRWNPSKGSNGAEDTIAEGFFTSGITVTSYTHFTIPINYFTGEIPDTIQVAFSSSYKFLSSPPVGSVMFVDSLTFSKDTSAASGINILNNKGISVSCYPNPAKNNLNILISEPTAGMVIKVYDLLGRNVLSVNNEGAITSIDVSDFSTGAYFYEVADEAGNVLKTEKFTVVR